MLNVSSDYLLYFFFLFSVFLNFRQMFLNIVNPCNITGMCTHDFGCWTGFSSWHFLPECNSHVWVVACYCHQNESYVVRLCILCLPIRNRRWTVRRKARDDILSTAFHRLACRTICEGRYHRHRYASNYIFGHFSTRHTSGSRLKPSFSPDRTRLRYWEQAECHKERLFSIPYKKFFDRMPGECRLTVTAACPKRGPEYLCK